MELACVLPPRMRLTRREPTLRNAIALVCVVGALLLTGSGAFAQDVPPPQDAQVQAEAPLSNADVVKLCKLDLGDEIVIAKINQSAAVDFRLDTDSLVTLKTEGVSKPVIEAMLKRATPPESVAPGNSSPGSAPGMPNSFGGGEAVTGAMSQGYARLCTKEGDLELTSIAGSVSATYAFVTMLQFMDYPELAASVRTSDISPSVLLRVQGSPTGRVFWVRADPDKNDNVRSVKVGRGGMFGVKSITTPDKDWTIPFETKEEQPGLWRLTPKKPLKSGEYGIWVGTGELYDFAVD